MNGSGVPIYSRRSMWRQQVGSGTEQDQHENPNTRGTAKERPQGWCKQKSTGLRIAMAALGYPKGQRQYIYIYIYKRGGILVKLTIHMADD